MYKYLINDLKSEIRAANNANMVFADGVSVKLLEDTMKQLELSKTKIDKLEDENAKLRNETKQIINTVLHEFVAKIMNTYRHSNVVLDSADICIASKSNLINLVDEYLKEF